MPYRPRSVRTPGCGSVAVSDRAHTVPGSLPEIAALTLPDHRFVVCCWMLSTMIARAGEFRNRLSGNLADGSLEGAVRRPCSPAVELLLQCALTIVLRGCVRSAQVPLAGGRPYYISRAGRLGLRHGINRILLWACICGHASLLTNPAN